MVQNEGYDIKLGTVNFDSDTFATGARRVLLVTSLDNDEATAGSAVSLGDTNVTATSTTSIVAAASGTASTAMTLNASGIASATTDPDGIVAATDIGASGAYTLNGALASATSINSFTTITNGDATNNSTHTFTVTGTDVYGVAQTETITGLNGNGLVATGTKIFKTITGVTTSADSGSVQIGTKNAVVNQSSLITVTSAASDETGKTFTIVGTDMNGTAQTETIVGPAANATVTGRKIFKTIHSVTPSANTTGNISVGVKGADSVIVTGQLELSSSNSFTVSGEDGKGLFELSPGAATLDKLEGVNVKTRQSSVDALRVLDRSLDRIHKERAKLGALMSRMEKAIDNLSNVALNTEVSRGRLEDADFAKESARSTKAQILQQSAMAMIAQAGKAQQNVLQLLQQ